MLTAASATEAIGKASNSVEAAADDDSSLIESFLVHDGLVEIHDCVFLVHESACWPLAGFIATV